MVKGIVINKTTDLLFEQCPYYIYYHIHTARCEPCLNHCIIIGICTLHNVYTYFAIHARPERLYDYISHSIMYVI